MQNSYELPDLKTLGIFGTLAISALAFFGIAYNNRLQSITPATSIPLSKNDIDSLSETMHRYGEFINNAGDDIETIWQILREHNSELSAYDEQIAIEYTKFKSSGVIVKGMTHFQQENIANIKTGCPRYSELLTMYRELRKTYPKAEFESWDTVEERRKITVKMVEDAHADFEEHHMRLLNVAEELLTESGVTVQRARSIIEKLSAYKSVVKSLNPK